MTGSIANASNAAGPPGPLSSRGPSLIAVATKGKYSHVAELIGRVRKNRVRDMADKKYKSELKQDPLVDKSRPDPSDPPSVELCGFLGKSDKQGYWRLYL